MKQPLCKLTDIPETGTKLVPFFGKRSIFRSLP